MNSSPDDRIRALILDHVSSAINKMTGDSWTLEVLDPAETAGQIRAAALPDSPSSGICPIKVGGNYPMGFLVCLSPGFTD